MLMLSGGHTLAIYLRLTPFPYSFTQKTSRTCRTNLFSTSFIKHAVFFLISKKRLETLEGVKASDHPFGGQDVNASDLRWALSAVSTRAFRLHGDINLHVPMMLPLIDMCNHSFSPNVRIIQEQDGSDSNTLVKVVAETEVKENDPLLLNYGSLSNDSFLLDYGFVVESNPYDTIEIKYDERLLNSASMAAGVAYGKFSSPAPWQHKLLSQLNLAGKMPNLKVTLGGQETVDGGHKNTAFR